MYRFNVSIKVEYINYEISRYVQIFLTATTKKFSAVRKYKKIILFSRD